MTIEAMDTQEVLGVAAQIEAQAALLSDILGRADSIHGRIPALWDGHDAEQAVRWWREQHRTELVAVRDAVAGFARSLRNNAADQSRASGGAGGSAAAGAVGLGLAAAGGAAALPEGWSTMAPRERVQALLRTDWAEADRIWQGLSREERRAIALAGRDYGNFDWVPATLRYAINRERVFDEYMRLNALPGYGGEADRYELYGRLLREHQQVLFFDPAGDGRIGVVHGDLNRASSVAVQVPGITNTLDNYGNMLDASQRLHGAAASSDVAVVSWLGYETPGFNAEALIGDFADGGAGGLVQMVNALDRARPDASITVIGHSYGSMVTSLAAERGMAADTIVLIGSPGVHAGSVSDYVRPDGSRPEVFVGTNVSDYVHNASEAVHPIVGRGFHGSNPGDGNFRADHVRDFYGVDGVKNGHEYYAGGSDQLEWLAGIIRSG